MFPPSFLFQRVGANSTSSRRRERASWLVRERRARGDRGRPTFLGVEAQEATWRIDRVALASTTTAFEPPGIGERLRSCS